MIILRFFSFGISSAIKKISNKYSFSFYYFYNLNICYNQSSVVQILQIRFILFFKGILTQKFYLANRSFFIFKI